MKISYDLPVRPQSIASTESGPLPISLSASVLPGSVDVIWEVDQSTLYINSVQIVIINDPIRVSSNGSVSTDYPEYREPIFQVASYIADYVLSRSGVDAIDPSGILSGRPTVEPETPDEVAKLNSSALSGAAYASASALLRLTAPFSPADIATGERHRSAWASFSTALRTSDPFVRYEYFFKVVDYFFLKDQKSLDDTLVSNYLFQHDQKFDKAKIVGLRRARNRIAHLHPSAGSHLSHNNLNDVQYVESLLPEMRRIADLLLLAPPW